MLADVTGTADHVLRNRAGGTGGRQYAGPGLRSWRGRADLGHLGHPRGAGRRAAGRPGRARQHRAGCGTGYVSAWLARRGARPVGIDNSAAQLATARELQERFGLRFPLIHGNAERVPFPDGSFDLAISEYGASIWCDPYRWIPEAARLLRPGGELVFLVNSVVSCSRARRDELPATGRLVRP